MEDDICQNIILSINDSESLINLYLTDKRFQKLLDTKHILGLLAIKFNVIYNAYDFSDFIYDVGSFMIPEYDEYGPTTDSGEHFTHNNGCVPYKVVISDRTVI